MSGLDSLVACEENVAAAIRVSSRPKLFDGIICSVAKLFECLGRLYGILIRIWTGVSEMFSEQMPLPLSRDCRRLVA